MDNISLPCFRPVYMACAAVGVALDRRCQRPDWRPVARLLGARPSPAVQQRAILIQGYRDVLPLSLYMPGLQAWSQMVSRALTNRQPKYDDLLLQGHQVAAGGH